MSCQCVECGCDDRSLTCHDPRTPPLELGLCLCPSCGRRAYEDRVQEIYDDVCDELGVERANAVFEGVKR